MAGFRCRSCGEEGTFVFDGRRDCPNCGSVDVQFAIGVDELVDDHPFVEPMTGLAGEDAEKTDET